MTRGCSTAWAVLVCTLCASASAQMLGLDVRKAWINPGFYSYHLQRDKNLDNVNPGLGFELPLTDTYSFTAGVFHNSDRATSHYVGIYAMPYRLGPFKAGAVIGGFNGYPKAFNGGWFPAAIPVLSMEGRQLGLNVGFVPTVGDRLHGAVSFQLKYRFSD
jgi:hypothetical protein